MIKAQLKQGSQGISNKEKKIKPLKQPTKAPRNLLSHSKKLQDPMMKGSDKESIMKSKLPGTMGISKPEEHKLSNLENVCTDLLQAGCVQSYIDLFYISHKCLPNVMQYQNYFGENLHVPQLPQEVSEETIQFSKDLGESLSKAEVRPQSMLSEKQASMNEYNSMAFNYEDQGNYVTACYFYRKVIDIATSCKNKQFELIAQLGLGKCFDQENNKDEAIDILQMAFDNAAIIQSEEQRSEMIKLIGKELIEIYIKKANECEKYNLQLGLQSYESALKIAQRSKELQSEARISHKIGQLYYQEANYNQSVSYQQNYLELLKKSLDEEYERLSMEEGNQKKDSTQQKLNLKFKEMEAHASLAKCYLKLKNIQKSQVHLNDYHRMAKEAKAQNSVADSSYYLAKLFEEKGEKEKSIHFYQSYFEAAKSEKPDKKDRKLVDKARVSFAIAKSNRNMDKYIGIMGEEQKVSLDALLNWKIKRILK